MAKKITTILSQNKFRSYSGLNTPTNFNFIPIEVGHVQCPRGYEWTRTANRLTIHYVMSGKGVFEKDGKSYNLSHGDCFVIDCREPVKYTADKVDPWHYYWIHFHSPKFAKKLKTLECPVFKTVNESAFTDSAAKGECGILTSEFIISKLYLLHDDIFAQHSKSSSDLAIDVARCINDNYNRPLTIESLSANFNVSSTYISRKFREKHGISIKQYIIKIRLAKAKEFLEKGLSVKETAYLCGYNDQLTFSKIFKKFYGVTPKSVNNTLE